MFFKTIKNKIFLLLILFIIPTITLAYSDYIIAGGENIGIELNSNGIIIVGTYNIDNINPAKDAGLQIGDRIIKVNGQNVDNISSMLNILENSINKDDLTITYMRGNKESTTTTKLVKSNDNTYKTGLYVKDSITGIGTLTFIDPNTSLFGALGHEIIEKNTGQKLEIKGGKIYNSTVTGIFKSSSGNPGEKNARYNSNITYGDIKKNTTKGIFGTYTDNIPDKKLYKVANYDEIEVGNASIFTVVDDNNIREFTINILKVNKNDNVTKNILFEVTDEELLKTSGGIVQGMSGSPIIQNNNIIGAVTHVVIDDPRKGYGIFITKMLEEAEN